MQGGDTDTECEAGLSIGFITMATLTDLRGNPSGGTEYIDFCPSGEALMGFDGCQEENGYLSLLTAHCGVTSLCCHGGNCTVDVTATGGTSLPTRGELCTTAWQRMCPENHVIVGFGGRSGVYMDQLIFRCAPIVVETDGVDYTATAGAVV